MSTPRELIESAFDRLSNQQGFVERPSQRQLALLLSDLLEGSTTGAFEAPTGLGKSLAILVPAIAHAISTGKRVVVATYTNVLAEQYWRLDLPLALSLFQDTERLRTQYLIGKQRYACLATVRMHEPSAFERLRSAKLGVESEVRGLLGKAKWTDVSIPEACPGRLCDLYDECFYYRARKSAQKAEIVITNHSVVIQDALMSKAMEGEGSILGEFDFLVLDEAHDFSQAALNGLEFELSDSKLASVSRLAVGLRGVLSGHVSEASIDHLVSDLRKELDTASKELDHLPAQSDRILAVCPKEFEQYPAVLQRLDRGLLDRANAISMKLAVATDAFVESAQDLLEAATEENPSRAWQIRESSGTYIAYLRGFAESCRELLKPDGVSVSYVGSSFNRPFIRRDKIGLAEPLRELIWEATPWACVSATLSLDGDFEHFCRSTGAEPTFMEILPSPFDLEHQAAIYLPRDGAIPNPSNARREGQEEGYYAAVAAELSRIITLMGGRTLALFHSRREMEAVAGMVKVPPSLPVLVQPKTGASWIGQAFRKQKESSLFALRSFWTGFDAAGETLSCVAIVRVPFEVPIDPPQIVRAAWYETQGLDPFQAHTLAQAKMLMRQGFGRLIRRDTDVGLVALLDARIREKRYGEQILDNLPRNLRVFDTVEDAIGWLGFGNVTNAVIHPSNEQIAQIGK